MARSLAGRDGERWTRAAGVLAALALAAVVAAAPAHAAATGWRRIAAGARVFLTDRVRYAAWQRPGSAIVVLDTHRHRAGAMAPGCELGGSASGGRFLVACGRLQELLDARTGSLTPLPALEYAAWTVVGLRYVGGGAARGTHCGARPTHDQCVALYDIATGSVRSVPALKMADLDSPTAAPICGAARARVLKVARYEGFEPFGYSYERGLLATPEQVGERPLSLLRIDTCAGRSTLVHTRPYPLGIELSGGVLLWTAQSAPLEPLAKAEEIARTTSELEAYSVSGGRRLAWSVPRVRVKLRNCGEPSPLGAEGAGAHTDRAVFWVALTEAECGEKGGAAPVAFEVFQRPLRQPHS